MLRSKIALLAGVGFSTVALMAGTVAPSASAAPHGTTRFTEFTASNHARSNYHYYPSPTPSRGLLVYLDGDGQWGHDHPRSSYALGGRHGIVAQAHARGMNVLSVRTPARDQTWWTNCGRNATYLNDLLRHIDATRGYDKNDLWIAGFSGGAQFTTQCFLPRSADTVHGGGTVVFGGGGKPWGRNDRVNPGQARSISMNFVTGDRDIAENSDEDYDALGYAREGARYYRDRGFYVNTLWMPGVDHESIGGTFGWHVGRALDGNRRR